MIVKYDNYKYLNTDCIASILPDRNDYLGSIISLTNGKLLYIKTSTLKEILKKLKIEDVE